MSVNVDITQTAILTVLRSFLLTILPSTVSVIRGQDNLVSEPSASDYVVMTPIARRRLATNIDTFTEISFTGSISGTILTTTQAIVPAAAIDGLGLAPGTVVVSGTAPSYVISPSQTVASQTMFAGTRSAQASTEIAVQLDVHGPNGADNAQSITTWLRDGYACDTMASSGVQPLYPSDPRQLPFINGERQYEDRWSIDVMLQANPIVTLGQQFAGAVTIIPESVDAEFPPS